MTKITHTKFSKDDFFTGEGTDRLSTDAFDAFNDFGLFVGEEGGFGFKLSNKGMTEQTFFDKFDVMGGASGDDTLSTGEALLGLARLDGQQAFADPQNIVSIDEKTVKDYLHAAEKMFKDKDKSVQYKKALKFLFSAIDGFSNRDANRLANDLKGNTADEIMTELGFIGDVNENDEELVFSGGTVMAKPI